MKTAPEIVKTDKMLLLEERAGRDVRLVLREAMEEGRKLEGAAAYITEHWGVSMNISLLADWITALRGRTRKTLEFEGFEAPAEAVR